MPITMKGLSLWQPWASLMAVGAKRIETRSWSTDYRGLVAIHAAKRFQEMERLLVNNIHFYNALWPEYDLGTIDSDRPRPDLVIKALPLGCFVAVGKLRHCLSTNANLKPIPLRDSDEYHFGDYSENRWMWVFDEVWKLSSPVHAIGQRNLWTLDERTKDVIIAMLPEEVREWEFGE